MRKTPNSFTGRTVDAGKASTSVPWPISPASVPSVNLLGIETPSEKPVLLVVLEPKESKPESVENEELVVLESRTKSPFAFLLPTSVDPSPT